MDLWLTHPDVPDSLVRQPADVPIVATLKAQGWVETDDPELADELGVADEPTPVAPAVDAPPKTGSGSSRDAWAAYAAAVGVETTDDMTRDDIVAAVENAQPAQHEEH